MRRTFALLIIALLVVPRASAKDKSDWQSVKRLRRDTALLVILGDGQRTKGGFLEATDSTLVLTTLDCSDIDTGWTCHLDRADVKRVIRIHEDLPDPEEWMAIGTAGGGVVGLAIGASIEKGVNAKGDAIVDGFRGAAVGFLASMVAVLGATIVEAVRYPRGQKLIYENLSARTLTRP
jgi:hypothetical protein